jgi:hypothetical protein
MLRSRSGHLDHRHAIPDQAASLLYTDKDANSGPGHPAPGTVLLPEALLDGYLRPAVPFRAHTVHPLPHGTPQPRLLMPVMPPSCQ